MPLLLACRDKNRRRPAAFCEETGTPPPDQPGDDHATPWDPAPWWIHERRRPLQVAVFAAIVKLHDKIQNTGLGVNRDRQITGQEAKRLRTPARLLPRSRAQCCGHGWK